MNRIAAIFHLKFLFIALAAVLITIVVPTLLTATYFLLKCPKQKIEIPIQDHTVQINNLTIYFRTAGDPTKQPIVFLHGWGARKDGFCGNDGVIAELAKHFYVIAPENPGLIRSETPKEIWNYGDYGEFIHSFLGPLNLKKPIIMGQSFGGGIATAYAALYPEKIKSLVLIDSNTTKRPQNMFVKTKNIWNKFSYKVLSSRFTPFLIKKIVIHLYFGTPFSHINQNTAEDQSIMGLINIQLELDSLEFDYKSFPPILFVWGNKDTFATPLKRAEEIHEEVEGSKLIVVPGSHTVLYQRPKEIVDLIVQNI